MSSSSEENRNAWPEFAPDQWRRDFNKQFVAWIQIQFNERERNKRWLKYFAVCCLVAGIVVTLIGLLRDPAHEKFIDDFEIFFFGYVPTRCRDPMVDIRNINKRTLVHVCWKTAIFFCGRHVPLDLSGDYVNSTEYNACSGVCAMHDTVEKIRDEEEEDERQFIETEEELRSIETKCAYSRSTTCFSLNETRR